MATPTSEEKQKLRDIRRLCKLGALKPEQLDQFFVETEQARDPHANLRMRLGEALEDGEDVHILVYGHGGSGKSTELVKLTEELDSEFFTVNFSVLDHLDILSVTAAEILVIVAEQVIETAHATQLPIDDALLQPIYEWFAKETVSLTDDVQSQLTAAAEASIGTSYLSLLARLMASIKGELKLSTARTKSRVMQLSNSPRDLIDKINALLDSVRSALEVDQRLLIIVEDADKLDIKTANQVFVNDANLLTSINADIIYTIPLFTYYSPDSQVLRNKFGAYFSLPMIKVADCIGQRFDEGFETVRRIIRRRIPESGLTEEAANLLIAKTGGVLQHVFEVINTAAFMTDARVPLETEHIAYALQRKKRELQGDITIPVGGIPGMEKAKVEDLFQRLAKHAKSQLQGEEGLLENDPINQILLKTCALVEYNGKSWHGVHPLVQDILRDLHLLD